ncbi:MAG TPA: RNA-directed DNA polymerase [Ktedonobacteraceae bacterium]|nr:RNA-directed DNA polymerase [Ktedonobacteraceae bacterium]
MLDGTLYKIDADWPTFWEKSIEKAAQIGGYIAIADVSNYYNQIHHHRLENHLTSAGFPQEAAKSINNLLSNLTQGVSRGIPVGPHATHLLAECVFNPIDRNLLTEGYIFCRFVDDIHIFCKTRQEAQIAFYDLAEFLDKEQKLILQSHKSRILPAEEFIEYASRIITEAPLSHLEKEIVEVIDRYSHGDRYRNIDFAILSEEDLAILSQENLEILLNSYLTHDEPNFTRIRWLFRRLAQVGVPGAVPLAVAKVEQFSPALADLASYLLSARYNYSGNWGQVGEDILHALELPIIEHSEYLTVILLDLFAQLPILNHNDSILQKYRTNSSSPMVKRKIVRATTAHRAEHWLRLRKGDFDSADPWLKRALMAGASTFSKDERKFWLRRLEKRSELEKFVAKWAESES